MDGDLFKGMSKSTANKTMPANSNKPASIMQRNKSKRCFPITHSPKKNRYSCVIVPYNNKYVSF